MLLMTGYKRYYTKSEKAENNYQNAFLRYEHKLLFGAHPNIKTKKPISRLILKIVSKVTNN